MHWRNRITACRAVLNSYDCYVCLTNLGNLTGLNVEMSLSTGCSARFCVTLCVIRISLAKYFCIVLLVWWDFFPYLRVENLRSTFLSILLLFFLWYMCFYFTLSRFSFLLIQNFIEYELIEESSRTRSITFVIDFVSSHSIQNLLNLSILWTNYNQKINCQEPPTCYLLMKEYEVKNSGFVYV